MRLHGRNYRDWFRQKATRNERYDYLYTPEELAPWVARIREIAARPQAREVYAVTNNHVIGKAPANGAMIESMLSGREGARAARPFRALPRRAGAVRRSGRR